MPLRTWIAPLVATVALLQSAPIARQPLRRVELQVTGGAELRTWDAFTTRESRSGALRVASISRDPALPERTIERFAQYHRGVRIWGADVVRDSENGQPRAIYGVLEPEPALSTGARLTLDEGTRRLAAIGGAGAVMLRPAELVIVRLDSGELRLAYTGVVSSADVGVIRAFADADTGAELLRFSEVQTQGAAVGVGRGVLGDQKKLSVRQQGSAYVADDGLRPPVLRTYDFRGDLGRMLGVVFGGGPLFPSDLASDADNDWGDVAQVDAHVHVGWTYDYLFKRFGRRGLDDRDRPVVVLTNGVSQLAALTLPPGLFLDFAVNAFWCDSCGPDGVGVMYFGNGLPPGFFLTATGNNYTYFSGALDIAAHELAHGVTSSTSGLVYRGESGALNESFSDIIGTSVEFFYHPAGSGRGQADYVMGEDISRGLRPGAIDGDRSMANPALFGDPDHYSRRYTGTADNGGVHINSGIPNHAFYLAIEGGTNRTSGLSVQGVGAANREQIERVFYRAFVFMLPANATFSIARAATIQAARDLHGVGSAAERAVTQAWDAVGVF
jgi:thermolysin